MKTALNYLWQWFSCKQPWMWKISGTVKLMWHLPCTVDLTAPSTTSMTWHLPRTIQLPHPSTTPTKEPWPSPTYTNTPCFSAPFSWGQPAKANQPAKTHLAIQSARTQAVSQPARTPSTFQPARGPPAGLQTSSSSWLTILVSEGKSVESVPS